VKGVHNLSQIMFKLFKSTISTRKTISYAGFHLTFSNFISNFRNQPLEAKKYENVLDKDPQVPRKVLSFAIHLVGSLFLGSIYKFVNAPVLDFPCSTALNNVQSRELHVLSVPSLCDMLFFYGFLFVQL
jgi:hypothetical protein